MKNTKKAKRVLNVLLLFTVMGISAYAGTTHGIDIKSSADKVLDVAKQFFYYISMAALVMAIIAGIKGKQAGWIFFGVFALTIALANVDNIMKLIPGFSAGLLM